MGSEPLVCISAGRGAGDPATLLGLQSFRHMAAKLRGAYDLVVVVGPALGGGEGSLPALAAEADGLVAALAERPAGRDGRELRTALAALPTAVLGAVVVNA